MAALALSGTGCAQRAPQAKVAALSPEFLSNGLGPAPPTTTPIAPTPVASNDPVASAVADSTPAVMVADNDDAPPKPSKPAPKSQKTLKTPKASLAVAKLTKKKR